MMSNYMLENDLVEEFNKYKCIKSWGIKIKGG